MRLFRKSALFLIWLLEVARLLPLQAFSFNGPPSRKSFSSSFSQQARSFLPASKEENIDYSNEETLLCVHLSLKSNVSLEQALESVASYSQSFPFAAVLPVQPLMYLPADDGVDIKFLRKKTDIKSGTDGGIRFFVQPLDDDGLEVTAKRNSQGQSIQKIMAEKLVVLAYVSGITGEETNKYGQAPVDMVQVESIFHKWM